MANRRRHGRQAGLTAGLGFIVIAAVVSPPTALGVARRASVEVGPGKVAVALRGPGELRLEITPNRPVSRNTITLRVTRGGVPVRRARVTASITMQDMAMGTHTLRLNETQHGVYSYSGPVFAMAGSWLVEFAVAPRGRQHFTVRIMDNIET
jgi:hypothetical protein